MIFALVIFGLIGFVISSSLMNSTDFGFMKCTILGLTLVIPICLMALEIGFSFISTNAFKLGLALGGESIDSVTEAVMRNILKKSGLDIKGVKSDHKPKDDEKLQ